MKRKKRIGLLTLLSLFIASILTATSFGYWNLSSEVSATISENTQNVETKVNQYTSDRAVCYLDNAPAVFYTSIEKALKVATSGRTVFVIPGLKGTDGNSYPIHIKNDCTIPSGVTLSLPYDGTTVFDSAAHGPNTNFADYNLAAVKTNRQTQVVIDENVTLTVNGTLNIGGIIGAPSAGVSGNTTSSYCEITMSANSQIICESGKIYCYGYIKRTAASNNSLLTIGATGKLHSPFVIYDFKGGSATLGIYNLSGDNRFCPFAVFDVCNVQTKTMIKSGAYWETRTLVYIGTNETYYPENDADRIINFISPSSTKTAIILTSGYLTTEYTPQTNGITSANASSSNTMITIYGTAEIGSISLSLKVTAAIITKTISIDTGNFFFPISYRLSITVENGGVLNVPKKVKAMNGSDLLVKKGGTVNITNQLIVYDDFVENTASLPNPYPSGLPAATLVNNGVINVTGSGAIGGYINTTESGATLNYQSSIFSVSSPEYGGTMPSGSDAALKSSACTVTQYTKKTTGPLTNGNDITFDGEILQATNYPSTVNPNDVSKFCWYYSELIVPVSLEDVNIATGSSSQNDSKGTLVVSASPVPSNATGVTYIWKISNNDSSLTISPISGNSTTISNTSESELSCTISVTATDYSGKSIPPKSLNVTVKGKKTSACLAKGTPILMGDNTYKNIEDLVVGDIIRTFNHETGRTENQPITFIPYREERVFDVLKLHFDNDVTIDVLYGHGFMNADTRLYEEIRYENVSKKIGNNYIFTDYEGNFSSHKLTSYSITSQITESYSLASAYNLNHIVSGALCISDDIEGLYNYFDLDASYKYDPIKMEEDINRYGLMSYDEVSYFMPREIYETFNVKYLSVSIGKGLITMAIMEEYISKYA